MDVIQREFGQSSNLLFLSSSEDGLILLHDWLTVEVSASGWSLVQRSPTDCDASDCVREASMMRRHWSPRGCLPWGGKKGLPD